MDDEIISLIQRCLDRKFSVTIIRCGKYARPGRPYLCRVSSGHGTGERDHLVYGDDVPAMMKEAMEQVLEHGFTQDQNRYGF
jgi:hypothetical protein